MKAFPLYFKHPTTGAIVENQGMELRDWFAGLAMQQLINSGEKKNFSAESAYFWADLMMKAREGKND